jgi:hypothetical protein
MTTRLTVVRADCIVYPLSRCDSPGFFTHSCFAGWVRMLSQYQSQSQIQGSSIFVHSLTCVMSSEKALQGFICIMNQEGANLAKSTLHLATTLRFNSEQLTTAAMADATTGQCA